jgi:hypothetical protein
VFLPPLLFFPSSSLPAFFFLAGRTVVSPQGKLINVFLTWTGNGAGATSFEELLIARLLSNSILE